MDHQAVGDGHQEGGDHGRVESDRLHADDRVSSLTERMDGEGTWLGRPWWRTGANVETKLLLLGRAFEQLGCERVELKGDARSSAAMVLARVRPAPESERIAPAA